MTDLALSILLPALDIAAFERVEENGFRPLAQPRAWFGRLSRDGTFPFLGHILEEARVFWRSGDEGVREWDRARNSPRTDASSTTWSRH